MMRGIAIREELTDEWKNRGLKEEPEYASSKPETPQRWMVTKSTQLSPLLLASPCRPALSF
jgi:hypothetical protein